MPPLARTRMRTRAARHTHFVCRKHQRDPEAAARERARVEEQRERRPYVAIRTRFLDDAIAHFVAGAPHPHEVHTDRARRGQLTFSSLCAQLAARAPGDIVAATPAGAREPASLRQLVLLGAGLDSRAYRLDCLREADVRSRARAGHARPASLTARTRACMCGRSSSLTKRRCSRTRTRAWRRQARLSARPGDQRWSAISPSRPSRRPRASQPRPRTAQ
jgi:hypothetical protein